MAAIFLIGFILLVVIGNEGAGMYFSHCSDEDADFPDCLMEDLEAEMEEDEKEGTVVATGVYTYKGYSVTMTANIPLAGGAVTGVLSGTCEGKMKGNYNGQQGGNFSGTMTGACSPFFVNIPASALFTGSVNKTGKTAPISFTGKGGGITHEGSVTLVYP